jgi:hypothetical protein
MFVLQCANIVTMFKCVKIALLASLLFCAGRTAAQSVEKEHLAVLELGGAAFWDIKNATSSFGPSVALEVTPIENWLELEAGTTVLFRRHSTEWGTDLVFKKPWDLSEKVEFMLGAGPEWVHSKQSGITTNSISAEAVADFMFWHSAKRKFGWYVEPTYEYNFGRGREHSLGVTGGLLISLR